MLQMDDSDFPLIVSRWSGAVSNADIDEYVSHMHKMTARAITENVRLVVVAGTVKELELAAAQRKHMNERLQTFSPQEIDHWAAITMNLASVATRGLIKALQWISAGSSTALLGKLQTFGSFEEAMSKAKELARKSAA